MQNAFEYSWKIGIEECFQENGDSWDNLVYSTLPIEGLAQTFDDCAGTEEGFPFIVWTKEFIYFPITCDGAEWVDYLPLNRQTMDRINFEPHHFGC